MLVFALRIWVVAMIVVSAAVATAAQKNICDLGLTVFSYDLLNSPKNRLIRVNVELSGQGTDEKSVVSDSAEASFRGLKEGTYKLSFEVSGYKKRSKDIQLDCDLSDEDGAVWNDTYLWRDKKAPANDADLVPHKYAEPHEASSKTITSPDKTILGKVYLQLVIDEDGNVISASRIEGDKRLADKAVKMAKQTKFSPTVIGGVPVRVTGSIGYNFVP
jgi:hypothetical protein